MAWSRLVRGTMLRRIRAQNLTLCRSRRAPSLRSLSTESGNTSLLSASDEDLVASAYHAARFIQHLARCEKHTGIVYKCLDIISHNTVFESCSFDTKLKVLSTAFDQIRNYPQADPSEVFLMKIYLRTMLTDDGKNNITRNEVVSRVLDVIQSYPKVGHYEVTEETRFIDDLGFDDLDLDLVQKGLTLEFKLYVPSTSKVKYTIDFIYENRMDRDDLESFLEIDLVCLFWPTPLG